MNGLAIERGAAIEANGRRYTIMHVLGFDAVMAQDNETGKPERLAIADIRPPADTDAAVDAVPDLSQLDDRDWDTARRRQTIVKRLLAKPRRPRSEVVEAANDLGVDAATVYRWIRAYRDTGRLSVLLPAKPNGGRGRTRLSPEIEKILDIAIKEFYLTRQQPSVQATADEVARLCRGAGISPAPHVNTVRARISATSERTRLKRRAHAKVAADRFSLRPGTYDEPHHPLSVVQIDHTKLDIVLVDAEHRLPIGRPWITVAFDVYSRMVFGFYVSLDPPGALSTGLALAQGILPKETWLAKRKITHDWPVWGFPACIHMDNAREFHGEMLRRACEQYGIEIIFRPVATPHFGGHIERMMGTLATAVHALPGTTFSNPRAKGEYDSEETAALTLDELEYSLANYITGVYHRKLHSGIKTSPIKRWTDAILGDGARIGVGMMKRPTDEERLQLDFTPYEERTVQSYGVRIDDVHYYSDVLRPYVNAIERGRKRTFIFRRDPRDVSRIHFWDPDLNQYSVIPYRDTTRPAASVWELRAARKRLEEQGRSEIDEAAIFEALEELRKHHDAAAEATKVARRSRERRVISARLTPKDKAPAPVAPRSTPIKPFEIDDV